MYGDDFIFHGALLIPFCFIELSPPDPNMSTYLDRCDRHLSDSIIFFCYLQVGSDIIAIRYNQKLTFLALAWFRSAILVSSSAKFEPRFQSFDLWPSLSLPLRNL